MHYPRNMGRNRAVSNKASYNEGSRKSNTLEEINSRLRTLEECNQKVTDLLSLVKDLRTQIEDKDKKIRSLESRVDELEQYTRQDDLVITGLKTRHKSYARATLSEPVHDSQHAPYEEMESLYDQVVSFIGDNMGVQLQENDVSICHTLPGKKETPNIVLRLTSRKAKNKILKQTKQLKGTNVYINEHLTKKNMSIAATARKLRKEKKILNTWTRNCKIFVKFSLNDQMTTKIVTEMQDFQRLNLT